MGARAYIIVETQPNVFIAVYGHWTANRIYEISEKGIVQSEIYDKIYELWKSDYDEKKNNSDPLIYKLNNRDLYKFIDFTSIGIEIYAVLLQNKRVEIFLTLINNYLNGAIRINKLYTPFTLRYVFKEVNDIDAIIHFAEFLKMDKKLLKKKLLEYWRKNKFFFDGELIIAKNLYEAITSHQTPPLRSTRIILCY